MILRFAIHLTLRRFLITAHLIACSRIIHCFVYTQNDFDPNSHMVVDRNIGFVLSEECFSTLLPLPCHLLPQRCPLSNKSMTSFTKKHLILDEVLIIFPLVANSQPIYNMKLFSPQHLPPHEKSL